MPLNITHLSQLLDPAFDTVIDVRSPAEYDEDHLPGAINLPALSNDERARIGTIYKQVAPFEARKAGAALVARNVAHHLEAALADKDGGWMPLVYCWRGGQRSGSFAAILSQIGWRAETIKGGYQTYRRLVQRSLYDDPLPHRFILLDGYTGTAKTALLPLLAARGAQVIDLEGLAGHRGSLLGRLPDGQPSQKAFETALAAALAALDPTRPVVVEAESSKIGAINLPPQLWAGMTAAPRIDVQAPLSARAAFLARAYADIAADPAEVKDRIAPLRHLRGHAIVDKWEALVAAGDKEAFAAAIMQDHYDPAYAKSRNIDDRKMLGTVQTDRLDADGRTALADRIMPLILGFDVDT
jgi:tRNA 2-selenouridine synthase